MKFEIGLLVCTLICLAMGVMLGITGFFMDNQTLLEFGRQAVMLAIMLGIFLFIVSWGHIISHEESPRPPVNDFPDNL